MASNRKSLDKWIDEAMHDVDKEAPISAISLVHMVGMQRQELHSVRFKPSQSYDAKTLATLFYGKAEAYCQDLPGVQTFCLLAFYNKAVEEAKQPFIVNVHADTFNSGLSTEAPTEQGRMQQIMRQGEMLMQQVYRRQQVMDDHAIRVIEQQSRMIEGLRAESIDSFSIVRDLLMQRDNNNHERAMAQLNFQRATEERKKWMSFAPPLINTLLGRELFPQATEDSALVEQITEALTEEHIAQLAGILPQELWGPLAARMQKFMEKKRLAQEAKAALPAYNGAPEKDITGGAE